MEIKTSELSPHPKNTQIYDAPSGIEWEHFLQSIKENGILEPLLINPLNTIISGHRRWQAAVELGLEQVPCLILEQMGELEELKTIVEANRYRKKLLHEIRHEAELLEEVEGKLAIERKKMAGHGIEPVKDTGRSSEKIARALGIGSFTTYDRLKKIWMVSDTEPAVAEAMKQVDQGKKSLNSVWKMTQKLIYGSAKEEEFGFDLQVYDKWLFGEPNNFGRVHPGRLPGQLIQNVLHYWSEPGDLVVDPFGGGGTTIDACESMERECLVYDIAPVRDDIKQWNISNGFPDEAKDCQLIFADPPYWNMLDKEYLALSPDSCAGLSMDGFKTFLHKLVVNSYLTLETGGHFACIIMAQRSKLPSGVSFIDWPFLVETYMNFAGFEIVEHVIEQWPTSIYQPYDVSNAKKNKVLLGITGGLIVGRKN